VGGLGEVVILVLEGMVVLVVVVQEETRVRAAVLLVQGEV